MSEQEKQEILRKHLAKLAKEGRLTAEQVVEDARKKSSPIHDRFEWDDSKAAHQYRVEQARGLIASDKVEIHCDERIISAPVYIRDPRVPHDKQGYVSVASIRNERDHAREALLHEMANAAAYLDRVRALSVAMSLEGEVDEIIENFSAFRERLLAA